MTHDEKVKYLDQLEDSLVRAETSRKDVDLLVCLRVLYFLFKDEVKNDSVEANNEGGKMRSLRSDRIK